MTIEEALYTHLTNDAGVSALVGARVYPLLAPQDAARPYIVYQRISTPRVRSHSGPSGLAYPRFQLTCVADSYGATRDVVNAVRAALDGYKGDMGDSPGIRTVGFAENEEEGGAQPYEQGMAVYVVRLDVILWHRES